MNTNTTQFKPHPPSQVQRISKEGQDKDANFLALRQLNKKARVRLSVDPINLDPIPGRGTLFATANSLGCFAAVVCKATGEHALIVSNIADLRAAFASTSSAEELPFTPQRTVPLIAPVAAIAFASGGSRLLIAYAQGAVAVYDTRTILASDTEFNPLFVYQSSTGTAPRELAANPGGLVDLVAVLYESGGAPDGQVVQLLDVQQLRVVGGWVSGGTPETTPASISWSPKGKQLAIGLHNGDIITFSPSDTASLKSSVPAPPSVQGQSLIGMTWLSNQDFHCIYAPAGPLTPESEQTHVVLSLDAKSNTVTDVKLNSPYFPVPALRPPGAFTAVFRQWDPAKFLLFIGDSTSSDIGLLGCMDDASGEVWFNMSLEETSTPNLPLDKDMKDTILVGLALDLTATEKYDYTTVSGEVVSMPPPPIMYAYVNDGTIVGWHIINVDGKFYPGMTAAVSTMDNTNVSMDTVADSEEKAAVSAAPAASAFAQPTDAKSFFGQPSALGSGAQSSSAFGQGFGQPSALGSTSSSAFGQSSSLGGASAFENKGPLNGGFGGFASTGTSKFGQLGFGNSLTSLSTPQDGTSLASPMAISMSNSEEPMSADAETDTGMGGLSLGGSSSTDPSKTNNMFGSFATPSTDTTQPQPAFKTSAFGSGSGPGVLKPATGFGAFASQGPSAFGFGTPKAEESKPSAFGAFGSTPATSATESKPSAFSGAGATTAQASPAFGQSSFGAKSAFGQSSFGQSSFGQSAFGQSAFGATPAKSAFSTNAGTGTSSGGFAAFASGGPTGFASLAKSIETEQKPTATTDAGKTSTAVSQTALKEEMMESKPPSPAPLAGIANDVSPSTADKKPVSAFGTSPSTGTPATPKAQNATPSASAFTTSVTAPASGAFAGLTTHPTGFSKLDSGFGAFGGPSISSSSPFLNPKPATASAFGSSAPTFSTSASAPATSAGSTKPTFGSPSAFGAAAPGSKPAFGASSSLSSSYSVSTSAFGSKTPPSTPVASSAASTPRAFSAFSGSGGFASFAGGGAKSSFKDLLKSGGTSTGEKGKERENDKESEKQGVEERAKEPAKETAKAEAKSKAQSGIPRWSPAAPVYDTRKTVIPTRTKQSYSDYIKERDEEDETGEAPEGSEDDDSDSFLSESFSDEEEELAAAAKNEEAGSRATPTNAAAEAEPVIELVSSLPETPTPQEKGKSPLKTEEASTTPPGSPSKVGTSPPEASPAVAAPKPVAAPSAPAASLGLARGKSTKPLRSSPLASAPISGDEGGEEEDLEDVTIIAPPRDVEATPEVKQPTSTAPAVAPISPALTDTSPEGKPASSRPKTPPLLPSFSTPKPPPFTLAPSTTTAAPSGAKTGSIFSTPLTGSSSFGKPTAEPAPSTSTPATSGLFGMKPASPPVTPPATGIFGQKPPSPALGGLFGTKPASTSPSPTASVSQTTNILTTPMPPLSTGGLFGSQPAGSPAAQTPNAMGAAGLAPKLPSFPSPAFPAGGLFSQPTPQAKQSPAQPAAAAALTPASQAEEGLQRACMSLYEIPNKELDQLKALGGQIKKRQADLYRSTGEGKTVDDLSDQQKFTVADAAEINRLILGLEQDVAAMRTLKAAYLKSVAELEGSMLRATMRKEEIVRFSKASTDAEFSKMLKTRTLGPDHLETQIQLRRGIRVIADRVQKLEDYIQASKKRLSQVKAGKPGIRPPSLDTVNRSFRNIEIAISQLDEDAARLKPRVAKLDLSTHSPARMLRGKSLTPAMGSSSPSNDAVDVTSNVAVTTAAALNAERAAQKLKGALLNVRKEPLLNKQASKAPTPPSAFYTSPKPPKKEWEPPAADFFNSTSTVSDWKLPSPQPSTDATPQWTLPPFQLPDTSSTASSTPSHGTSLRQRNAGGKMHQKPIQLKKSPGAPPASSPAPSFSWGPLPGVAPMSTLSSNVTQKAESNRPNLPSSLSDSWVTDGFGKK